MRDDNESAVVACEIKIGVAGRSVEEIQRLIERIREACVTSDYKLEIHFSGEFFKNRDNFPHKDRITGASTDGIKMPS